MNEAASHRLLSLGEFAAGGAIVIAHNVVHVLPNEVPILVILALISFRLREGRWGIIGFSRPASWGKTIAIAFAAAATRILAGSLLIEPLAAHIWPPMVAPHGTNAIAGNVPVALKWLLIVWTFAAFGEEIGYRGYLLTRAADIGGRSRAAYWIGVIAVSVLFGFGHFYKGPAGILDSGMAGLVLGAAYLLSGRNLMVCILAHGIIDTVGVVAAFFGATG